MPCLRVSLTLLKRKWNTQKYKGIKKGAPLSPNLFVNLKSNTMKNTMQRYDISRHRAIYLLDFL